MNGDNCFAECVGVLVLGPISYSAPLTPNRTVSPSTVEVIFQRRGYYLSHLSLPDRGGLLHRAQLPSCAPTTTPQIAHTIERKVAANCSCPLRSAASARAARRSARSASWTICLSSC